MVSLLSVFGLSGGSTSSSSRNHQNSSTFFLLLVASYLLCYAPSTYAQEEDEALSLLRREFEEKQRNLISEYEEKIITMEKLSNDKRIQMAQQFEEESKREKEFLIKGYEEKMEDLNNKVRESDAERRKLWEEGEQSKKKIKEIEAGGDRYLEEQQNRCNNDLEEARSQCSRSLEESKGQCKNDLEASRSQCSQSLDEAKGHCQHEIGKHAAAGELMKQTHEEEKQKIVADSNRSVEMANSQCQNHLATEKNKFEAASEGQKEHYETKIGHLNKELSEKQGDWDILKEQNSIQNSEIEDLKERQRKLVKLHEADLSKAKTESKDNLFKLNKYRKEGKEMYNQVNTLEKIVRKHEQMYCNYTNINSDFTRAKNIVADHVSKSANYYYDINVSPETQEMISDVLSTHVVPRWILLKNNVINFLQNVSDLGAHVLHTNVVHKQCEPQAIRALKRDIRSRAAGNLDLPAINRLIDNLCKNHQWKMSKYLFHFSFGIFFFILFRRMLWRLFVTIVFLPITIIMAPITVPRYFVRKLFGLNPDGSMKHEPVKNSKRKVSAQKKNQ